MSVAKNTATCQTFGQGILIGPGRKGSRFHQDISISSDVIQQFVFQKHISKPKLGHLIGTVARIRPIFLCFIRRQVKHKTVDDFGSN